MKDAIQCGISAMKKIIAGLIILMALYFVLHPLYYEGDASRLLEFVLLICLVVALGKMINRKDDA